MNTKKIILILGIIVIVLALLLLLIINIMRPKETPTPTSTATNQNNAIPTGVIVPTRDIGVNGFDIISINPPDQSANVSPNQIITITFSRQFQENEIEFNISPSTPHRVTQDGNKLIIFPQTTWETGTPYGYSVNFAENNEKVRLYRFTTSGPTPEFLPDTQPEGAYEKQEEDLKANYTDYYVNNNLPYQTETFSAVSEYNPNPPEHFFFTVTSKTPDTTRARTDFNTWLRSLDLTDEQISRLDIQYK